MNVVSGLYFGPSKADESSWRTRDWLMLRCCGMLTCCLSAWPAPDELQGAVLIVSASRGAWDTPAHDPAVRHSPIRWTDRFKETTKKKLKIKALPLRWCQPSWTLNPITRETDNHLHPRDIFRRSGLYFHYSRIYTIRPSQKQNSPGVCL